MSSARYRFYCGTDCCWAYSDWWLVSDKSRGQTLHQGPAANQELFSSGRSLFQRPWPYSRALWFCIEILQSGLHKLSTASCPATDALNSRRSARCVNQSQAACTTAWTSCRDELSCIQLYVSLGPSSSRSSPTYVLLTSASAHG